MKNEIKPYKIVIAIIENDGKILISKVRPDKADKFNGLNYVFPGGKVEEDETLEQALIREVKSETGLDISPVGQISYNIDPVTNENVYYYHCQASNYDQDFVINNSNTEELLWVDYKDLDKYHSYYGPDVKEYISFLVTRSKGI